MALRSKAALNKLISSRLGDSLMSNLERRLLRRTNLVRVLTYHRVTDPSGFEGQMKYLAENYPVVSMAEMFSCRQGKQQLPPRAVMITFDDAYQDFADYAWPILRRYRLPVTLFVPTGFPDHPERIFWWDRLKYALENTPRRNVLNTPFGRFSLETDDDRRRAFRQLRSHLKGLPHGELLVWTHKLCDQLEAPQPKHEVLDWSALRRLHAEGVTLGAHTRNHPLMDRIAPEQAESEAVGSLRDLQDQVGSVQPIFAYPDGRFSSEVIERLRRAGFAMAYTTIRGTNDMPRADPLKLRRNNIQQLTVPVLRARLINAALPLN
jgi:peptidoglycan/xylan/chitin deacetylase (PgdA/CDA1 family)